MKIAIISDWHLGFGAGTGRKKDAFEQAKQAVEIAVKEGADLLLVPGDIFDSDLPSPEALFEFFEIAKLLKKHKPSVGIEAVSRDGTKKIADCDCLPIIAIHGTHEFRSKDYKNMLNVLEEAGAIVYLHASKAVVKKGSEEVAIHGLGGIPEKFAKQAFGQWSPKPESGKKNVLVLHQSIKEFLPTDDEMSATLSLEDLPKGFDFVVNGHLHWQSEQKLGGTTLLMPGSTVITQMKNLESKKPKGFLLLDTHSGSHEFKEIPRQRKLFYEKIVFENASMEEVHKRVSECLAKIVSNSFELQPLVRLKLRGTLAKGLLPQDLCIGEQLKRFDGEAIISCDEEFSEVSLKKKIEELRALQKSKASIAEMGLNLLEKNLAETGFGNAFDARRLFQLLAEKDTDKALGLVLAKEKEK